MYEANSIHVLVISEGHYLHCTGVMKITPLSNTSQHIDVLLITVEPIVV